MTKFEHRIELKDLGIKNWPMARIVYTLYKNYQGFTGADFQIKRES